MNSSAIADALLPGSGLVVDGRPAAGITLLVPAVLILAALLVAVLIGGFAAAWVAPRAIPAYLVLIGIAALLRWQISRRERIDPQEARRLARETSRAWLRDEPAATTLAGELVRAAPEMAQAWRLHAQVTGDARSLRRAASIEGR